MDKLGITIIVLIGILLRLVMLDKPEGLWNDEYVTYMISAKPIFDGFISGIKSQCHMPLYYIYLKSVMALFGQSDIVLRASSVVTGVLAIIVMYFTGLEKDRRTGLLCAGFTCISSFLIYYSQEVRIYSILFLFSALTLWSTLRVVKQPDIKNLILFICSNFLVLTTHTIGFVFVFFNLIYVSYKLYKTHKTIIIKLWASIAVLILLILPQVCSILLKKSFSQWWGHFTPSVFGFLITDYFSPVITNFTGASQSFFYNFKSGFIIFAIIPSLISMLFLGISLKNKENREFFYIVLATLAVMTLAAISGKLVFITKYSIEVYPILIYLVCVGASDLNNKIVRNILISVFCILNLFFLLTSPFAANRLVRKEGHNLAAILLKDAALQPGDVIILQYYDKNRFNKYFDFSDYKVITMNKGNFFQYIDPAATYESSYKQGKELFRDDFLTTENKYFATKLKNDIPSNNQNIVILLMKSVSFFSDEQIQKIAENDSYYKRTPLFFLVFSYLKNQTINELLKNYELTDSKQNGEWAAIKFTKINN